MRYCLLQWCLLPGLLLTDWLAWGQPPETARVVVRGFVRDAQGQPVAGATVACLGPNTRLSVETDAEGRYELPALPPGDHQLTVSAKGFLDEQVALKLTAARLEEMVEVTLQRPVTVTLHLRTADGEPVRQAKGRFTANELGHGDLETDENGDCRLILKPGSAPLFLWIADYVQANLGQFTAAEDGPHEFNFTLAPGSVLRYRVLQADGVTPAAGVQHQCSLRGTDAQGQEQSIFVASLPLPKDGVGRLDYLPEGTYTLSVQIGPARLVRENLVLKTGAETQVDFTMPTGAIAGRVLGADGQPLAGAVVFLAPEKWPEHPGFIPSAPPYDTESVKTNEEGRFCIEPIPDGTYDLAVIALGHERIRQPGVTVAEGKETAVDVRVNPTDAGTLRLRVAQANGEPLANAEIRLELEIEGTVPYQLPPDRRGAGGGMGSRSDGEHTTYSLSVTPHTDKEGVFWFPEVAPGSYCLKVNVPGFPPQPDLQFEVAPREDKEVNIVLPGVGGLEGRAIHADGETPFAGVYVVAVPVGESLDVRYETRGQAGKGLETRYPWSTTDVNGRYTLERLGEGLYTLWLVGEGKPLPNLWEMSEGQPLAVRERVRVRPDQVLGGLDLRAWQEPEAEPPPGIIAGRITLPDGTPAAALRFHYRLLTEKGEQELRWPWITPEADGRYRLADVPPGRYDLVIFTPGYLQGEARGLVVEPGQTCADADVRLPRPATLRLRVVDPQGQPVAGAKMFYEREGAKVELRDGGSRSVRGFRDGPATNAEGLLELAEILPGRYRVVVKPESWASQLKTLEVHDGETVEEALTVSSGATLRGTVARPDGTPLAKARVTASLENDPTEHMLTGWAQTDEAGHFTLHVQAPGTYRLSAWAQDHHSVRGEPLGVAEGQAVDDWAFRLAPHEIGALAVQVVAPDGETPVAGAMVGFSPYFIETTPTTDKEGRVDLKQVLLSDDNVLTVYHPDFAVTRVKHPPLQANATTPLKVQMSRGGAIVGTVRPAAGPPGGFLVVAGATETDPTTYHPGDYGSRVPSFFSAVTQPDGSYRIDQLAPGTYTVFLYRGEVGPRVDGVSVADGQTTESVDLTLANARP